MILRCYLWEINLKNAFNQVTLINVLNQLKQMFKDILTNSKRILIDKNIYLMNDKDSQILEYQLIQFYKQNYFKMFLLEFTNNLNSLY